jgi:hypothetical protein
LDSDSGIALVITLIMLSVITFMAVTFLVLARGHKGSVTTATDQTLARLAADSALERAQAELLAPMLASSNEFDFDILVSTNYLSFGFTNSGPGYTSPANVNYAYPNGASLTGKDALQNLANLFYSPRPPVFIITNRALGRSDFRFYLDLNRNGAFDPSGMLGVTNSLGQPIPNASFPETNYFTGDPQWIGGLQFPDRPHSADNPFLYRYAYLVVPAGKTLDINYIYNQAARPDKPRLDPSGNDYFRNQGVGTWELNLAAFLYDLNTNTYAWGGRYVYVPQAYFATINGNAFYDAFTVLTNRYAGTLTSLAPVSGAGGLFGNGLPTFAGDAADDYSAGPLLTNNWLTVRDPDTIRTRFPWSGANNTNHFFSPQELFDRTKTSDSFVAHLTNACTGVSSYDRYTFYRLLSQLGSDSDPEPPDKVNINYISTRGFSATNFIPWDTTTNPVIAAQLGQPGSVVFFTNAVDKLLRAQGFPFGVTRIPVYTNRTFVYTPSVHRLLQLAANIYDSASSLNTNFPTVFRPICQTIGTAVYITGFEEITNKITQLDWRKSIDLPTLPALTNIGPNDLLYGVPLIIGAKKGLPNLNEVAMQCVVQFTRKLQLTRATATTPRAQWRTNVMYIMGITNALGVEAWNSYRSNYSRPVDLYVTNLLTIALTNETGRSWVITNQPYASVLTMGLTSSGWPGIGVADNNPNLRSLIVPLRTNISFLPTSVYRFGTVSFDKNLNLPFEAVPGFPMPHWGLNVANRLQFMIVDRQTQRIIDYVHLTSMGGVRDLSQEIADPDNSLGFEGLWSTNRVGGDRINGPPMGFLNQIFVCLDPSNDNVDWTSYGPYNQVNGATKQKELEGFREFYFGNSSSKLTELQVPFSPSIRVAQYLTWQANDPLVHYTAGDLSYLAGGSGFIKEKRFNSLQPLLPNIGKINDRYSPWGGNRLKSGGDQGASSDPNVFNLAVKDPLVTGSDAWDFPNNKLPNIGWLGRVHRGTPWQTVYLKSTDIAATAAGLGVWTNWTGNFDVIDAKRSSPANDRKLLEVFTAALNENATRGQLSINQTNLAAWSAVLSGVVALCGNTNANLSHPAAVFPWVVAQPVGTDGTNSPLWQIVTAMNDVRRTNYSGSFKALGDFLATPEFTESSPFLNLEAMTPDQRNWGISDDVYERLPQQILGLLKCDHNPRFVIYSYGQALKPAARSIVTSGQYFGLCTNYQITAEVASRTVVRIEGAPTNSHAVIENFNLLPPD